MKVTRLQISVLVLSSIGMVGTTLAYIWMDVSVPISYYTPPPSRAGTGHLSPTRIPFHAPPVATLAPDPNPSGWEISLTALLGVKAVPGGVPSVTPSSAPSTPSPPTPPPPPLSAVVHFSSSNRTCPEEYRLAPVVGVDKPCERLCAAAQGCVYFRTDGKRCDLFSQCPEEKDSDTIATTYAFGNRVFSREQHAEMRRGEVSHLWRVKPFSEEYLGNEVDWRQLTPPCVLETFERTYQTRRGDDTQIPELGVDRVYMVHYTPLVERRRVVTQIHRNQSIESDWVTPYDKQAISPAERECITGWHPTQYTSKSKQARRYPSPFLRPEGLTGGELSVNTKHHFIYYDMVRRNITLALVLEDDAKLRAGFRRHLVTVLQEAPSGFDILMIGGCLRLFAWRVYKFQTVPVSRHLYRKAEARCAHAYVLTLRGAKKLLASMPITEAIDYQINAAIRETGMNVFWVEPWLSVQGNVGEAGQPRAKRTEGGDGLPFDLPNLHDPTYVRTWEEGVPPQYEKTLLKVPSSSSQPLCTRKGPRKCYWI